MSLAQTAIFSNLSLCGQMPDDSLNTFLLENKQIATIMVAMLVHKSNMFHII